MIGVFVLVATGASGQIAVASACGNYLEIPRVDATPIARATSLTERLAIFRAHHAEHGPIFRYDRGKTLVVHVTGPEMISAILKNGTALERTYDDFGVRFTLGKNGILGLPDGDLWQQIHKVLAPELTRRQVRSRYEDQMAATTRRVLSASLRSDGWLSVGPFADWLSGAVMHRLLFGFELERDDYEQLAAVASAARRGRVKASATKTEFRRRFEDYVERYIARITDDALTKIFWRQDKRIAARNWVMDQVITLYFAGEDTTRILLARALSELARAPQEQRRFRDAFDSSAAERFLKEVLRRHSVIAIVQRRAARDVALGEYLIPKAALVNMDYQATHLDAQMFPDPLAFDPERFARDQIKPLSFCPFGAGPRVCIGQHLATFEVEVILRTLLEDFEILSNEVIPAPNEQRSGPIGIDPEYGVRLIPRSQ